jgi:hypothetical protein
MSQEPEYEYVRCECPCHANPAIMHIAPCCDNGFKKVPLPRPEDAPRREEGSQEPETSRDEETDAPQRQ